MGEHARSHEARALRAHAKPMKPEGRNDGCRTRPPMVQVAVCCSLLGVRELCRSVTTRNKSHACDRSGWQARSYVRVGDGVAAAGRRRPARA